MNKKIENMSIAKAAALNAGAKYTTVILQLLYTAILSRILTPEDYGTVAVVNVFIVFFQLLADMGFGSGVIQNKELSKADISNIFSVMLFVGITLMGLFMAFSFAIADFYGDKIYISLGFILSFSLAFNSFNVIPNAIMLKNKRFLAIAIRTIVIALVAFSLTILFALKGFGVYSLVLYSVLNAVGLFIWNQISLKIKFTIKPDLTSIKKIWGYSMYQFGAQTLNYFNRNLDNLLIGKFFKKEDLGYYNKSYILMQYPINYIPGVITPVLHPILSEYQNNKNYIYEKYMQLIRVLSLLGCFGAAFCFFAGREIILIAFGSQWEMSILPFEMLCLSLWPQIITNTIAPIYQSIGNTKLMFKSLSITTVMIVGMIICGVFTHSIVKVAIFVSAAYIINFFLTYFILIYKGFGMSYTKFLLSFKYEIIIFAVLIIEAVFWPFTIENIWIGFAVKFLVMVLTYCLMLIVTKQGKVLMGFVRKNRSHDNVPTNK